MSSSPSQQPPRPSDARRKALNAELSIPLVSNFFPLERYYEAAEKVYQSFQIAFQEITSATKLTQELDESLDDAYVYGKRYCTFCLEGIPKHNYHGTPKFLPLQRKHTAQIDKVIQQLQVVANKMDEYEALKQAAAREAARKAAEAREQEELLRFAALQQRVEQQKKRSATAAKNNTQNTNTTNNNTVEASALSKLQLLLPPQPTRRIQRDPSGEEPLGPPSTRYGMDDEEDEENEMVSTSSVKPLPPPMLPTAIQPPPSPPTDGIPSAPPSYHQALQGRRQGSNFWGHQQQPTTTATSTTSSTAPFAKPDSVFAYQPPPSAPAAPPKKVPFRTLQKEYEQEYRRLQQQGFIRSTALDTYQGRVGASTNGCTVISALCVSRHLKNDGPGITNAQISDVIDRQCGPLLREIRSKLGLGGHALIIPSDVHDHLVDRHLLPQDKFLGVAGGNILDNEHTGEFFKLLASAHRIAAATLFFREHVISIVKYYNPASAFPNGVSSRSNGGNGHKDKGGYCYDLIDSLPGASGRATRTTCLGLEALVRYVRWYASQKFFGSHSQYVDQNEWNDMLADVDPRVFQAFVWGDPPLQQS